MIKSVLPGDLVAQGNYRVYSNVIKADSEYYSMFVGKAEVEDSRVTVIRLSGPYIPRVGDQIIGMVTDIQPLAVTVDINSYVNGYIMANAFFKRRIDPSKQDINEKVRIGDLLNVRVSRIERGRDVLLSLGPKWKVSGDAIFYISPAKASYLLRSKSNIINRIRAMTGTGITMGANGIMVARGGKDSIKKLNDIIKIIESHNELYELEGALKEALK